MTPSPSLRLPLSTPVPLPCYPQSLSPYPSVTMRFLSPMCSRISGVSGWPSDTFCTIKSLYRGLAYRTSPPETFSLSSMCSVQTSTSWDGSTSNSTELQWDAANDAYKRLSILPGTQGAFTMNEHEVLGSKYRGKVQSSTEPIFTFKGGSDKATPSAP